MSKRFLYRYKIVRLYEEDIWGIFFRKQKKRDLFFKKIGYQLFLEIFRKNSYLVNSTVLAWKKKLLYLGRQHTKKNVKCQYQLALNLKKKSKFFLVNKQTIYFKNSLKHFSLFLKDFFFVNRTYFFNETKKCLTISFLLLATVPKKISQKSLNKYVLYLKKALAFILLRYVFNDLEVFTKYVSQIVNTNFKFLYNFNYKYTDIVKWYNNLYYIRFITTLHNIESSWASSPLYHNNVLHANTLSLYLKNMRLNLYFKVFQLKEQISAWRYREESQLSKIFQPFFFRDTLLANRYQHSMWLPLWWYWRILQKKKKRKARYLRSRQFVKSFKHHNYKTNQRYKKSNPYKKPYKPYYKKPYKPYYKKSDNQQYSNSNNNKQQPHYYKPYHNNNKPYRKPYNNSYHKPYNNAETENKPYHKSYNKPYNNVETENKPYHNNNNKLYYKPKPQFNNKNNQNNKQPQAYKSQAQAHNKQSHKHAFKYKYKQPFKKAYNKRGAHYKYVHKRKQPILRIKRIRPQIKYFSLLSWYNWRVKNKKKFFRLKIKFAVFLHKWNLHKRENQLDLADLNIFKAKKKKYMFRYFLARKLLREPDSVYLNHIKGKRNLLIAKKSKIKAAVVKKPKTKVAVAKKAKTIVSLGKKLKTKVSVAKKSKTKVSVVKKPKTKVSSAKKSKTKVAVVKKPKTKVAVAKKAKTKVKVAVVKKAKTSVAVAKKPKTKESLVKEPKTSVAVVKKSKTKVSSAKKAKAKKIVAKPKKNSKMISLTRTSSILNKNTIPTTQKRFYTTETNIGYYKQNNAKPTFDQRRSWKPKNNNYKSNVTGKEKNFSGNFRKNKNVNYQKKEQIFIIGDNNTSDRRPKVKKKYFLNKKKNPNLKLKQFTRKRKSYKPLLKIQKKPLYPKVWKLEMLEFTMWGVAKPGGHFGGYIMPTKKKKKYLIRKLALNYFFEKLCKNCQGNFF